MILEHIEEHNGETDEGSNTVFRLVHLIIGTGAFLVDGSLRVPGIFIQ